MAASQKGGRLERLARTVAIEDAARDIYRVRLAEPVEFRLFMELLTENRLRAMHPIQRGRHVKAQRETVRLWWGVEVGITPVLPVIVTQTRIGRRMDPHDSLPAAFKHVTDEITLLLGLRNDDTPLVTWKFDQRPLRGGPSAIIIRVESRQDAA